MVFAKRMVAEMLGTAFLLAGVVGSGIMADSLTGDTGLALLANAIATGAILVVLIEVFGPVSGAHFNPAVSLAMALTRRLGPVMAVTYVVAQLAGAFAGVVAAHAMFGLELVQTGTTDRGGMNMMLAEGLATFGLVLAILAMVRQRPEVVSWVVGLYITAAYWFTASTSFANPAVTAARAFTDTFAGIALADTPAFFAAQLVAACAATGLAVWLFAPAPTPVSTDAA